MPREARSSSSYAFRSCFLISLLFAAQMQQSQSIICYQLVNAPTSLGDDIITYKSFVQRKRSSEAPCSSAATAAAAPCFFSALNPVFCGGSLAGTSRRSPSSWALLPLAVEQQNSPWISSTNWGDSLSLSLSLCTTIVHRACCPVHVRVGAVLSNDHLQGPCRWMILHKLYYF